MAGRDKIGESLLKCQIADLMRKTAASNLGTREPIEPEWLTYAAITASKDNMKVVEYRDKRQWDTVIVKFQSVNSEMISHQGAELRLIQLVSEFQSNNWNPECLNQLIDKLIRYAKEFKPEPVHVWVPIQGLNLEKDTSITLGDVTFHPRGVWKWIDNDVAQNWEPKSGSTGAFIGSPLQVQCIAKTITCGDQDRIREKALANVDYALNLLRAFLWPPGLQKTISYVLKRDVSGILIYYSSEEEAGSSGKSLSSWVDTRPTGVPYLTSDYFLYCESKPYFAKLGQILDQPPTKRTQMHKKLFRGLYWLGEAGKFDDLESQLVKTEFALEAMIGGDVKGVPLDSIRARLAERGAFIIGGTPDELHQTDNAIRYYVAKRNSIAHGDEVSIRPDEVADFAAIVRQVAMKLLDMESLVVGEIAELNHLQSWVFEKRYGKRTVSKTDE